LVSFTARFADATRRSAGQLEIADQPGCAALELRIEPAFAARLTSVLGADLPTRPNTVVAGRAGQLCWLGPDEWLVRNGADDLEAALRSAAGDTPLSVVDVSAARVVISLAGPAARQVLAHGCALDLDVRRFPPGSCAQTRLALANVVLIAEPDQAPEQFATAPRLLVLVRASFAPYLAAFLLDSATEYLDG
jgi:sarcosine oxidase subunit gamma